jgi:hypothetical protein
MDDHDAFFEGDIEQQRTALDRLKADLERVEGFAAASFVLNMTLIRELLVAGVLPRDRAVRLVENAIDALRRLYRLDDVDPFRNDTIDFDRLGAAIDAAQHEESAEALLRRLLATLTRDGGDAGS